MSVNLYKGQTISLDQQAGGVLAMATIGLGWYPVISKRFLGIALQAARVELEGVCTMFDGAGHAIDEICVRHPCSGDCSVLQFDNYEEFSVDLAHLPQRVASLLLTARGVAGADFSLVDTAYVRIADADSGGKVAYFTLPAGGDHGALVMARLFRCDDGWRMQALGDAIQNPDCTRSAATASGDQKISINSFNQ